MGLYVCVCLYVFVCMCLYVFVCMCVYMCMRVNVCVCVCVCDTSSSQSLGSSCIELLSLWLPALSKEAAQQLSARVASPVVRRSHAHCPKHPGACVFALFCVGCAPGNSTMGVQQGDEQAWQQTVAADLQWRAAALDSLWAFTTTALHGTRLVVMLLAAVGVLLFVCAVFFQTSNVEIQYAYNLCLLDACVCPTHLVPNLF